MNLFIACGLKVLITVVPGVSPMNDFDYKNLETAINRCAVHYPHSPCVKSFKKVGEQNYEVICSEETP